MATNPDARRSRERGLSLIEALIIVTITALLALLLLPMASRAAGRNFGLAERGVDDAAASIAETEFRAIVRASSRRMLDSVRSEGVEGQAGGVIVRPNLASPVACAREGAPQYVRLRILGRNRLVCESDGRRRELMRWTAGDGVFSYSADGRRWQASWSDPTVAPFVRFDLALADGRSLTWIEQAGAAEPRQPVSAP